MGMDTLGPLRVKKLSQIGIMVSDLEKTMEFYEKTFGVGHWSVFEGETEYCWYQGCETVVKGRIAMGYAGKVQFELIKILEGPSIYADFLGEKGEGLHHLGFFVKDLNERLRACEDMGIKVLQRGVLKQMGMKIDYAYLDTVETGGVIFEFIQTSFFGINAPQLPALMKLVAKLQRRFGR
jgi:methylmalonyl-CoA/ethylmalonyl-CoA epimerase